MGERSTIFTPSLFYKHAACPHWIWHDIYSDPKDKGEISELTQKIFEQGVLHEEEYMKDLTFTKVEEVDSEEAFQETMALMRAGTELIYQGVIQYQEGSITYRGRPDLLKKVEGKSAFGDFQYVPIDIKSSKEPKTEQKHQLTIYGEILEKIQGSFPAYVAIINKEKQTIQVVVGSIDREKTNSLAQTILEILDGKKPPLKLVSGCKDSPWFKKCVSDAEEKNDIALLYQLDARSHQGLRAIGINTVADAANMDVDRLPKIPYASPDTLARIKLQAQSLVDQDLKWLSKPQLPNPSLKIFFDIEGDPLLDLQYLFGFWVVGDPEFKYAKVGQVRPYPEEGKYFIYFLAEKVENEGELWRQFLAWIELLPEDFDVFHYANYEKTWLAKLAERYGGSAKLSTFQDKLFDLEKTRKESVIFPLYFYSIKDIAKSKFLDFKWRHAKAGGAQSIFWYKQWLVDGDRSVLNDIVDYNEDDVRATEYFYNWLVHHS